MIAKKKHSSLYCIISIVVTSLFVLRAFYFTHYEVQITSDTLEYYYNFKHIEDYLFPYGIEIVLPLSMMFVKLFGGDFNVYLFLRVKETECEQGMGRERETQNLKQAPGSELSA